LACTNRRAMVSRINKIYGFKYFRSRSIDRNLLIRVY
jgi:hypothetical protein